ncbi:MAG TPA: histidine kinase [Candidatus Acidoferrum sp.]|jgi:two-component system sensor histidine kinase DegS|nr:histidine kinase [Candidatus Acidoferrum sp.]
MNDWGHKLLLRYLATLQKYIASGREAVLEEAYELGRTAIARGLGVLDMARIHENAYAHLIRPLLVTERQDGVLEMAETFFLETLSPFEAAHRGFRETNVKLQQRNRELEAEIGVRKRAEKALRESREHFRELFIRARRMEENLRNLSNQILHVQEEERKHISRELHDEIGQAMTAISIKIEALGNNGAAGSDRFKQNAAETQALLLQTMETVHRFARELRPAMLDELGLLPAFRSYLKGFADRTRLRVRFRGNPIAEKLGNDQKTVLFRVAQESLTNVAKHARASQVKVVISKLKDGVCMLVADDGKSFTPGPMNSAKSRQRLGLLGMQERVRLVNGRFVVRPQPGKGTTVRVVIPFHAERAAMRWKAEREGGVKQFGVKHGNHN